MEELPEKKKAVAVILNCDPCSPDTARVCRDDTRWACARGPCVGISYRHLYDSLRFVSFCLCPNHRLFALGAINRISFQEPECCAEISE
jgi:hypothetical protein